MFISILDVRWLSLEKSKLNTMANTTDDLGFDLSQLDDTLISENQKQNLIDYINQLQTQKRSINDEFDQFKSSTGSRIKI